MLPVFDHFDDKFGGFQIEDEAQSGGEPFGDISMRLWPHRAPPISYIACVASKILNKNKTNHSKIGNVRRKFYRLKNEILNLPFAIVAVVDPF
jgi:hypothetical protein